MFGLIELISYIWQPLCREDYKYIT